MIYRIYYEGKRKFALPVKNREELLALRNSTENLTHLMAAQEGNQEEKGKLLQLAYNLGYAGGALAGCKSIGSYFFHDVDCYDKEHSEATKELILSKKDEIGLRMLERSVSGGWHLVCQRVPGTTILENQVRIATILQLEMDTSAKDLQRVVYSTSGSEEDLVFLDDCLFDEPMTAEECEKEYKLLKVRVMRRQEQVPPGAKKANKHYKPWEDGRWIRNATLCNAEKMEDGRWKEFFRVNGDLFLRTVCLVAVNLTFTALGARQGDTILAVNALLMQLFLLFSYILDGFAYAGEALGGRYWGAKDDVAFHSVVRRLFLCGGVMTVLFTLTYIIGGRPFLLLLTDEATVVSASEEYVWWAYLIPLCSVAAFIWDGIFIGTTQSRAMLLSAFIATMLFFATAYLTMPLCGNHGLWLALLAFLAARGVVQTLFFQSDKRSMKGKTC